MFRFTMDVRIFVLLFICGIVGSITASPSPNNSNSISNHNKLVDYYRHNPSLRESLELSTSSTTTESQSTSITTSTVTPTTITPTTITPTTITPTTVTPTTVTPTTITPTTVTPTMITPTTVTPTTITPTTVSVTPTPLSVSTSTETVTKPYATTTTDISTKNPQSVSKSDPLPKFESNENKPEKSNNNEKCQPNTDCSVNILYNPIRKPQFDPYAYCRDIWNQYQNPYRRFPSSNFWPQSPYGNPRIPTYGQQYPQFRHTLPYSNYYNPLSDYRSRYYNIELNNRYPMHGSAGNTPFGIGRNINAMFQEPEEALQTRMKQDYSQFDQFNPVFPQINRDVPIPR